METAGYVLPETETEARDIFEELEPAAEEVVGAIVRRLDIDPADRADIVTEDVYRTGHEALFGSLLVVTMGTMEEFEEWQSRAPYTDYDVDLEGSEHVDHVVWHATPVTETVIAATYQDERAAAVATLRRIAWGRVYRPML